MTETRRKQDSSAETVRVDKWLWAARFFKTRSLAAQSVKGGKVHINARRTKASAGVRVGDRVDIIKGDYAFEIDVLGLASQRGPASQAQQLYAETRASRDRREQYALERRTVRAATPRPAGRPDKKQRRSLRRFKQGG